MAVRCYSVFPVAAAGDPGRGSSELRAGSGDSLAQDSLAADLEDASEDGVDALIAPAPVRLIALAGGDTTGLESGALVAQRPRSSHAQSLDRPPRA